MSLHENSFWLDLKYFTQSERDKKMTAFWTEVVKSQQLFRINYVYT